MVVMTKADPTKKRTPLEISFNKCSLNSKCYIVFRPANNSYCITILQNYTKNCCQFVVNSDLMCQKPLILLGFLVERLHCGEQQHIPDACAVGKQHDKSVNAEAETACRRKSVLKRGDVIVIDLCVAVRLLGLLLRDLTLEAFLLVNRVVQFRKGIAELSRVDEVFKALGKGRVIWLALSKRADLHRIIVDKGRLYQLVLDISVKELGENRSLCCILRNLYTVSLCIGAGSLVGFP